MRRALLPGILALLTCGVLSAQSPAGAGRVPFGSYFSGTVDSVNIYNGNVMLDIPVFSLPGRELSTDLRLTYNSLGWVSETTMYGTYGHYKGGFNIVQLAGSAGITPYLVDCDYTGYPWVQPTGVYEFDVTWVDSSGATHYYPEQPYYNAPANGGCDYLSSMSWSDMGSHYLSSSTADDNSLAFLNMGTVTIYQMSGRLVTIGSSIFTRNGNFQSGILDDTLGRTISTSTTSSSGVIHQTYTVHDAGGTARDYTLHYETCHSVFNPVEAATECHSMLTGIDLPNGTSYGFVYGHDQGFLTRVNLPTGGFITYDYVDGIHNHDIDGNYIVERRVYRNDTDYDRWLYDRAVSGATRTVTVTDPANHQVVHVFTGGEYETGTEWKETSTASPSKSVSTIWTGGQPTVVGTQIGNLKQQQTFSWTGTVVTASTQSDWYTGSAVIPLTQTLTSYTSYSSEPSNDLFPAEVELKQWNGSSYVTQGKTQYLYDEYSLAAISGTIPHYSTPGVSRRNNLTTVRRYRDASNYVEDHFYYDIVGNVVTHVDARGKSTTFDYSDNFTDSDRNSHAFPKQVTDPNGHHITTVYDFNTGLPVSVADARGKVTSFDYDLLDRPLSINGPITNAVTSYTYTDATPKVAESVLVATGKTRTTETTMDKLGRPIQSKLFDPAGDVLVDTEYDGVGNIKKVSQPYRGSASAWTQTTYDVLGRPVTITNPDSSTVTMAYTANTVTQTDEAGNQRRYTSNALGQMTAVEEPDSNLSTPLVTNYSYYVYGPLHQVTQSGSLTRTFTTDWLGRMTEESHPETGTTHYTYDNGGLLTSRTDARSIVTDYSYDDAGRPLSVNYHDATPDIDYSYDQNTYTGLLTTVAVNGVTSTVFAYDDASQLTSEAVTLNGISAHTTSYSYDLGGRLLTVTYPSGRVVTQAYALSGAVAGTRLASLTDSPTSATLLQSTSDNAAGLITSRTLSSGIAETRTFNSRNQLTGVSATANSSTLLDLAYGYGSSNNGKIRSRTDAVQPEHSANYTFDSIGRLTAVSGGDSGWSIGYDLDASGNRAHQTRNGLASSAIATQTIGYSNNKNNGYTYDASGNVTNDGTYTYSYDAENRLYQVGSSAIQYAYDQEGRRIKKLVTGSTTVTTYYFYGLTGLTSEFSTSNSTADHTAAQSTDRIQYRIGEQTGTAVMLVASDGTPRENNRVFPFGEPWNTNAGSDNNEKFTTYQHDDETNLDYAMARYFVNRSGRFLSPDPGHVGADPSDPQTWNVYIYTLNDPVNYTDPFGTCIIPGHPEIECTDAPGQNITVTAGDDGYAGWIPPPGACLNITIDHISMGNTCDGRPSSAAAPYTQGVFEHITRGLYTAATYFSERIQEQADLYKKCSTPAGMYSADCKVMGTAVFVGAGMFVEAPELEGLVKTAAEEFPRKALSTEWHHAIPKYLGGGEDGLLVKINAAYHQQITNAFREAWAYGQARPTTKQLMEIVVKVYSKLPLPK